MDRQHGSAELDRWLGKLVFIRYMGSSDPSEEDLKQMGEVPSRMLTGPLKVVQHFALLETYDQFGIKVRFPVGVRRSFFLPWGAVLYVFPSPEQGQPPDQDQQEDTEETAPSPDRQELMGLLANAETQSQVAVAKAAADSYLATHPSDGDVRMAREQLEARFPEEADPR